MSWFFHFQAFGFDVSTPQAKPDALSMLSEAATNQRIQQQNVSVSVSREHDVCTPLFTII